jgi:hypothetical protein
MAGSYPLHAPRDTSSAELDRITGSERTEGSHGAPASKAEPPAKPQTFSASSKGGLTPAGPRPR